MKTQIIPLHLFFSSTYNNPHHTAIIKIIPYRISILSSTYYYDPHTSVVKKENWLNRPRAIFPRKISYAFSIENGDLLLDREGRAKGDYINKWDKRRSIVACTCRSVYGITGEGVASRIPACLRSIRSSANKMQIVALRTSLPCPLMPLPCPLIPLIARTSRGRVPRRAPCCWRQILLRAKLECLGLILISVQSGGEGQRVIRSVRRMFVRSFTFCRGKFI